MSDVHPSVRLLRRVSKEVRLRDRLEDFDRRLRPDAHHGAGGRPGVLSARGAVPLHRLSGPHQSAGQIPGM